MSKINKYARKIILFDSVLLGVLALLFIVPISGWFIGHMSLLLLEKIYLFVLFFWGVIKNLFWYGKYLLANGFDIIEQGAVDFYRFVVKQVLSFINYMGLYMPKIEFMDDSYILVKIGLGIFLTLLGWLVVWCIRNINKIRNNPCSVESLIFPCFCFMAFGIGGVGACLQTPFQPSSA